MRARLPLNMAEQIEMHSKASSSVNANARIDSAKNTPISLANM